MTHSEVNEIQTDIMKMKSTLQTMNEKFENKITNLNDKIDAKFDRLYFGVIKLLLFIYIIAVIFQFVFQLTHHS